MNPQEIVARLPEAVLVVSRDGVCDFANRPAAAILGFDPAGRRIDEGPMEATSLHEDMTEAWARLGSAGGNTLVSVARKNGPAWYWVSITAAGEDGRQLITILDIGPALSGSEELARIVSQLRHDLRSPLTSIVGAAELMKTERLGELGAPYRRMVRIVAESADRIEQILSDARRAYDGGSAGATEEVMDEQSQAADR